MAQIIIYTGPEGNVHLCKPSPQYMEETGATIEDVMAKDCPPYAVIVDDSIFPSGIDHEFFDAWEFDGTSITVNLDKCKVIKLRNYNSEALELASKRQLNTLAGIPNNPDEATFLAMLQNDRNAIASATSTSELEAMTPSFRQE